MWWSSSFSVRGWMQQNLWDPLVAIMEQGADPKTLAFSGALGCTIGIFPIYGVTALICAFAIGLLGKHCNAPTMMLVNLVATPVELSLVVPFLRLGELIVGGKHFEISKDALWNAITGKASWPVFIGLYHAFVGWIVAAPFVTIGLYFILLPLMKCSTRRFGHQQSEDQATPLIKVDDNVDVPDEV